MERINLFHYVDDFIVDLARSQPSMQKFRVFPKFVASFAARDSFYIETLANIVVRSESSAGDLVVYTANVPGKRVVHVGLTHNLVDLLHDIFDLIQGATNLSSPKDKS